MRSEWQVAMCERGTLGPSNISKGDRSSGPVMAVHHISLVWRMVLQILQRSPAEEIEAMSVIVAAVDAPHREHAVVRVQERCVELLHLAPEHSDVSAPPMEGGYFVDVVDEVIP
jgi:hypothetical protein